MHSALDISTSALVAHRIRLDAVSSNLANMSTTRGPNGEVKPYQTRYVEFQVDEDLRTKHGAVGVKVHSVKTDDVEPRYRYQPGHPMAIKSGPNAGNVAYPRVNMTREFVDALTATRAYEANIGVIETTRSMGRQTLRILG